MTLTIIGDTHGKLTEYFNIVKQHKYTLCVGDFGFANEYNELNRSGLDWKNHKILRGNHDDYNWPSPFVLPDFGVEKLDEIEFFFVRGANSIDKHLRTPYQSWWPNEQLDYSQAQEAAQLYSEIKPNLIITHDCPSCIVQKMFTYQPIRSYTGDLLDQLFHVHQPALWIFGHHHKSIQKNISGTLFVCLNELETYTLL